MEKFFKYSGIVKSGLNMWPPFRGAGIRIDELSKDYTRCRVSLKFRWWNKNANRTQFGGSIFSMTDPIYPLMFMGILGKDYVVWDKSAEVEYVSPGKKSLHAEFELSDEKINEIKLATENGEKILPEFLVSIKDQKGKEVAKVKRTLYIRKKKQQCH